MVLELSELRRNHAVHPASETELPFWFLPKLKTSPAPVTTNVCESPQATFLIFTSERLDICFGRKRSRGFPWPRRPKSPQPQLQILFLECDTAMVYSAPQMISSQSWPSSTCTTIGVFWLSALPWPS